MIYNQKKVKSGHRDDYKCWWYDDDNIVWSRITFFAFSFLTIDFIEEKQNKEWEKRFFVVLRILCLNIFSFSLFNIIDDCFSFACSCCRCNVEKKTIFLELECIAKIKFDGCFVFWGVKYKRIHYTMLVTGMIYLCV